MYNLFLKRKSILIVGLAFLFVISASAQMDLDPENDIPLSADIVSGSVASDGSGVLHLLIDMPEYTHITSRDFGFFFVEPDSIDGINWGITSFPSSVKVDEEDVYKGKVELTIPFSLSSFSVGDKVTIGGTVGYQICTESEPIYCTPPVERNFQTDFIVTAKSSGKTVTSNGTTPDTGEKLTIEQRAIQALESGSLIALIWIFLGGMLLSLTPCVYPMIPITIAYVGARAEGKRLKGLSLSLVFVLGLGLMYSSLGVVAAATGGVFGLSGQNPWVMGFVTVVFLIMGIGMLGAFDISLPSSFQTKITSGKRSGYLGAMLVGATTGLVAAPCVGPVLIALLGWVSSNGNLFLGFLYLFVFACGLGVLFIVIGTFAGAMTALPRAGMWMETVKKGFGVIMIAMAIYFGKPMVSSNLHTLIVGLSFLMFSGLIGAYSPLDPHSSIGQKVGKGFGRFVMIMGIFYVLLGLVRLEGLSFNGSGSGESNVTTSTQTHKSGINWIYDDEAVAKELSTSSGKPIIVDFWAEWCAACKELDHKTFSDPQVYNFINDSFIPLKINGTKVTDEIKAVWGRFGVKGLPTVLFLSPDGTELDRFEAFRTVEEVLPFLEQVTNPQ